MNKIQLKNIAKSINSGLTPLRSNFDFWNGGSVPWLKTEQLGEKYIYDTNEKITENAINNTSIKINPVNTISIAMYGEGRTRGNVSILKKEMATNQACCNVVLEEKMADYEFVYYFLKTKYEKLRSLSSGVRKNLNSEDIKNFEIVLPEKTDDQRKIASVLSALDSKIELNNRINAELEKIAKTLYDYWFVQFDFPDRNGKSYKSNGGKMVWNEELKREIPVGWEVEKINSKIKIGSGYPFKTEDYNDNGKYKIITIKCVQEGYLDTTKADKIDFIPGNLSDFCKLDKGDVLMSLTGNVGRMCFVDQKNLLLNQRVGKLMGNRNFVQYGYLYFQRPENQKRLGKIANGSSQSNLSPVDAVKDHFAVPEEEILSAFSTTINPIFQKLLKIQEENQKLAELRDWLLPMLMNGQVKVI